MWDLVEHDWALHYKLCGLLYNLKITLPWNSVKNSNLEHQPLTTVHFCTDMYFVSDNLAAVYIREKAWVYYYRVPGHTFLAWHSLWRMVVYIYYITAAVNSISSQLGSWRLGDLYGAEKAGGMARPSRTKSHPPDHSPPASQAGRRVGPASLVCMLVGAVMHPPAVICTLSINDRRLHWKDYGQRMHPPIFSRRQLGQSVFHQRQSSVKNFIYIFLKNTGFLFANRYSANHFATVLISNS